MVDADRRAMHVQCARAWVLILMSELYGNPAPAAVLNSTDRVSENRYSPGHVIRTPCVIRRKAPELIHHETQASSTWRPSQTRHHQFPSPGATGGRRATSSGRHLRPVGPGVDTPGGHSTSIRRLALNDSATVTAQSSEPSSPASDLSYFAQRRRACCGYRCNWSRISAHTTKESSCH